LIQKKTGSLSLERSWSQLSFSLDQKHHFPLLPMSDGKNIG
jgi:hypothetical protein